ncbi:MAG TPA: S41 family peptidase [Pyrinomonadaceae bacterium]|nr:S41 family peptidase [Pyrinomonadaceae bacterium]
MKHSRKIALSLAARARRRAVFAVALSLLFVSLVPRPLGAQQLDSFERGRAQRMLGVLKDELKKNYYDPNFHGMDVEARFKLADEKIKQATTLNQAFGIIAQAFLDLNDSHTTFSPPSRAVTVEYGWRSQAIGNECYVVAVKPGSDAAAKGLKPGDLILSVDGFKPNRKELWKMNYYYYGLSPRPGMRLVVQSPGQQPKQLDIAAKVKQGKRVLDLSGGSDLDINDYLRQLESGVMRHRFQKLGGVTVWKMPSFSFEPEQVDSIMNDHVKGNSALILDLRGNPGGYVVTLERLASYFFDRDVKIADLKGRKEMKPVVGKKRGAPFTGKLVVLVDSGSASCSELFARLVQLEKRGVVIGDQSAGAVMQSKYYSQEMGDSTVINYGASITNADFIMSDGKSLEHVGVTPEELLKPSAEDMANNRDPVLARAFDVLGVKVESARAGAMFPIEWEKN